MRSTIVRLLSNMASAKEIGLYLKRFSRVDAARFAVVKVGGAVLRDDLDALVSSLSFLQQVGLTPIVLHGAGPQLDAQCAAAGIVKQAVDGLRVTTPETLAVVRRVFAQENLRLVEALHGAGVRASAVLSGVFECDFLDQDKYQLVGKVRRVHTESLRAAIAAGSIPVIASLGETAGGQILNVNADWAANDLVKELQPYKIVFLTGSGGLLDGHGRVIESINLGSEYEALMRAPWLHSGMRVKIEQIHDLLMQLPPSSSVSITRPDELAKELFTHRGSGTLVRRGERIQMHAGWGTLDREQLRVLIESGFGRRLAADYFERTQPWRVFVSEHRRAALVLTEETFTDGERVPHLDKFAVANDAQGEGLGRAAWQAMRERVPKLFWRSRRDNPVNEFYLTQADGCIKGERWNVYWYGLETYSAIAEAVDHCRARPATLKEHAHG